MTFYALIAFKWTLASHAPIGKEKNANCRRLVERLDSRLIKKSPFYSIAI